MQVVKLTFIFQSYCNFFAIMNVVVTGPDIKDFILEALLLLLFFEAI